MIDLPQLHTWKILVQFKTERIKTCSNYDLLCGSVNNCCAHKTGVSFFSRRIMQQDSWDRDALDQLRDRSKPILSHDLQGETRLRRIRLQYLGAQICRSLRDQSRVFWVVMEKNQAGGNEQCCATSLFVLHSR